jgi:TusA-related sulfurtransferase
MPGDTLELLLDDGHWLPIRYEWSWQPNVPPTAHIALGLPDDARLAAVRPTHRVVRPAGARNPALASAAAGMKLERLAVGDIINVIWDRRAAVIDVLGHAGNAAGWRHASAREIVGHWRKAGRRGGGGGEDERELIVPREQLSLPRVHR